MSAAHKKCVTPVFGCGMYPRLSHSTKYTAHSGSTTPERGVSCLFTSQEWLSHKKLQKLMIWGWTLFSFTWRTPTETWQEFCLQKVIRNRGNIWNIYREEKAMSGESQRSSMLVPILAVLALWFCPFWACKPSRTGNLHPCVCTSAIIRACNEICLHFVCCKAFWLYIRPR